jgi:hypothetical protein
MSEESEINENLPLAMRALSYMRVQRQKDREFAGEKSE